jgi:hypothetical protein
MQYIHTKHAYAHTHAHMLTHTHIHTEKERERQSERASCDICMLWYEVIHPSGRLSRQSLRMLTYMCWNSEHRSTGSSLAQMLTATLRSTSRNSWYVLPQRPFSPTALARPFNALSWSKLDNRPTAAALLIHAARGTKDAAHQPKHQTLNPTRS